MEAWRRLLAVTLLAAAAAPAWAGEIVVFTDGRSLEVTGVERRDATAHVFLAEGGVLSLPAERIANWAALARRTEVPLAGAAGPSKRAHPAALAFDSRWRDAAGRYADLIDDMAVRHGVDPILLTAMAQVESAFDARAMSPKGACGLLQLMPDTADRFGVSDVFDAAQNVEGGARYFSWLLDRYDGRTELALAGYNAGEGAVDRHRGIPPYRETRRYVERVLDGAARLADLTP